MIARYPGAVLTRARSSSWYARLARYPTLHQFVRYAMVGVLNVGVGLAILNLLLINGVQANLAQAAAFLVTSIQGFALHKTWAFKDEGKHPLLRGYLVFLLLTTVGLAINQIVFTLLLLPMRPLGLLGKNLAALGAIPFSVAWNFMAYRRWTFNPAAPTAPAASERSPG
jgi:putative flippase GtrA